MVRNPFPYGSEFRALFRKMTADERNEIRELLQLTSAECAVIAIDTMDSATIFRLLELMDKRDADELAQAAELWVESLRATWGSEVQWES